MLIILVMRVFRARIEEKRVCVLPLFIFRLRPERQAPACVFLMVVAFQKIELFVIYILSSSNDTVTFTLCGPAQIGIP